MKTRGLDAPSAGAGGRIDASNRPASSVAVACRLAGTIPIAQHPCLLRWHGDGAVQGLRRRPSGVERPGAVLEGDGFVLRRWRMDDLDSLVRHADDEQVSRAVGDRFPYPYTRGDGERFLSGGVVDLSQPVFAIVVEGGACGGIGVRPGVDERACGAELGYWLGRAYWGRGLMTRVVAVYAPWVMQALSLHRLFALVQDDNPASAAVLLNNGFVEEGTQRCAVIKRGCLHDLRMFARTRERLDVPAGKP